MTSNCYLLVILNPEISSIIILKKMTNANVLYFNIKSNRLISWNPKFNKNIKKKKALKAPIFNITTSLKSEGQLEPWTNNFKI